MNLTLIGCGIRLGLLICQASIDREKTPFHDSWNGILTNKSPEPRALCICTYMFKIQKLVLKTQL